MANILRFFYDMLGVGWGWSIVLLTILIKLILFPISIKQLRSMEGMKKIQPLLKKVQEKYKNDPQELQKKTMELYKAHNVNPLGGCLPMLIQIPFLWALFGMLRAPEQFNIDFTTATFFGMNLLREGYIGLGIISGASTFLQQKLAPAGGTDSSQSTMMYIMPVFIGWITYTLKAGVGVYWVASTVLGIVQQWVFNRFFLDKESKEKAGEGELKTKPKTSKESS